MSFSIIWGAIPRPSSLASVREVCVSPHAMSVAAATSANVLIEGIRMSLG
jgi:hypothetical protein